MNTQYRKNLKDVATACKNYTDKRFEDFKWELGTHTIDTTTDSDVAYQKQAPNGTIGCQINSVGGMSYKSEGFEGIRDSAVTSVVTEGGNLLNVPNVSQTTNSYGITYKIEKGAIYLNGTATATHNITLNVNLTLNGTFSTNGFNTADKSNCVLNLYNENTYVAYIYGYGNAQRENLSISSTITKILISISSGAVLTNAVIKPMLVRGSTAPTEFKPYLSPITKTIPASIQALAGYGWGVNSSCYNYIDFENKKFVQKFGRIALNDLNVNSWVKTGSNNIVNNGLTPLGKASSLNVINTSTATMAIGGNTNQLVLLSTSYLNGTLIADWGLSDFKTYIANNTIYVYYELATPVETDISSYITDNDKFLEVEPLGTITFTNTYEQEVPSEITYLTEVAK